MSGITDEELERLKKWASVYHAFFPQRDILRLIIAFRASQDQYGNAVEAMRLCMKDLQEHGVIFAPGDPPYDILVEYDKEVES